MAAPSPSASPLRSRENGRQVSGAITPSDCQATHEPRLRHASLPPATTTSARPLRTMCIPSPSAWAEDAQALDSTKAGPCAPSIIATWLAGAEIIDVGMVWGWTRA